jgi:transcriptional regulator with XRE-family HTH domain
MSNEFSERLRKAITDKGISASELSRISGVGKSDISYYLKGRYLPKQDKCYMLARALDVNPGWLMTGVQQRSTEELREIPVKDTKELVKLIQAMSIEDYTLVMAAIDRTYKKMKQEGKL